MDFKIRSENELSGFSKQQREQYQKELELYEERSMFAEQLTRWEDVHVEPYEAQVGSIPAILQVDVKPIKKVEYTLQKRGMLVKPSVAVKPFKMPEFKKPILPVLAEKPEVSVQYTKKPIEFNLNLPKVNKAEVAVKKFKPIDINPSLPKVEQPVLVAITFKPLKRIQPTVQKVSMPELHIKPFIAPEKEPLVLPKVSMPAMDIKPFVKPQSSVVKVPVVEIKEPKTPCFQAMDLSGISLPKVSVSGDVTEKLHFQKADLSKVAVPKVTIPEVCIPSLKEVKEEPVGLPKVDIPEMEIKEFQKPELQELKLPTIQVPNVSVHKFEKVKGVPTDMPKAVQVKVPTMSFKPIGEINPKNQMKPIVISEVIIPSFKKPKKEETKMDIDTIAKMPELDSTLENIMALIKKETKVPVQH